jgi:hypothetical protein
MRESFNWSQLDRNNLYSMLYTAGRDIVGKKMPVGQLQKKLSTYIKSSLPVKVVRRRNDFKHDPKIVYMGGTYYSDRDQAGYTRFIEIVLSYHPFTEQIKMTEYRWRRLCSLFADTILHELIHMRQYRSRNFKLIPGYESTAHYHKQRQDQEYYGHRDEMGAFSFNIACDMLDRFGYNPVEIRKYMDSMRAKRHKSTSYCKFLTAFDWDHDHLKVRQMKKKILKQLEYAAIGRPFKTTTHLTY